MSTESRERELAEHLLRPIGVRVNDLKRTSREEFVEGRVREAIESGRENDLANAAQWKDPSGRAQ